MDNVGITCTTCTSINGLKRHLQYLWYAYHKPALFLTPHELFCCIFHNKANGIRNKCVNSEKKNRFKSFKKTFDFFSE